MIALADVVRGLGAAWRLAHFDRAGQVWVDATSAGFVLSFAAAIIVAPGWLLLKLLVWSDPPAPVAIDRAVAPFVLPPAYVLLWVAYPLAMSGVADVLGRGERWVAFVVANNWMQVVQLAVALPASVVIALLGPPWALPIASAVQTLLAAWSWFLAHVTLNIAGLPAAFVVVLDLVLSALIDGTMLRMIVQPAAG
ncbi:MAG: hypothetical protein EXQ97_04395 [Alphaproteobacteria bacterium]|nr:hypothetical protein [Alphaproteobacteria bacterium]